MEVIALNEVWNLQRANGAIWKKQACEDRRSWCEWISLNSFLKILLLRPWLCKVAHKKVLINWKGECTQWNLSFIWTFWGSSGFGSLLLNSKSCRKYGIIHCKNQIPLSSWGNLLWKQTEFKSLLVHKNSFILPVFLVYIQKLRLVFTFDFKRTLLWAIIGGKGCWLYCSFLFCIIQTFHTPLWSCLQPCHGRRNSFLNC